MFLAVLYYKVLYKASIDTGRILHDPKLYEIRIIDTVQSRQNLGPHNIGPETHAKFNKY